MILVCVHPRPCCARGVVLLLLLLLLLLLVGNDDRCPEHDRDRDGLFIDRVVIIVQDLEQESVLVWRPKVLDADDSAHTSL